MKTPQAESQFSSELRILKRIGRRIALWVLVVATGSYILSGIYVIRVDETGILKRFGRIVDDRIPPGLHYRFPSPVDQVMKVSTKEIRRFQAGFGADPDKVADYEHEYGAFDTNQVGSFLVPYCVTGDKNIIHMKVIAQYRIDDPKAYLIDFADAEGVALCCIQSAVLSRLASADVDSALTTGRVVLQRDIVKAVQRQLAAMNTGITVFSVEIKNARPPSSVAQAFKDVINAREERQTMVHDAHAYRNQMIPQGKAQASRILNQAEAYGTQKIAHAQGEAHRFTMLADEYRKNKEVTGRRLQLNAISEILPSVQKVIIGSENGKDVANLKFFTPGKK